ncbi:MAG: rod-binding protein [Pseudomonadota bacterium]
MSDLGVSPIGLADVYLDSKIQKNLPNFNLTGKKRPSYDEAVKASKEFEQLFIAQTFRSLFENVETEGAFGGGHAEKLFRDLLTDEYAQKVAENGGFGIADAVLKDILRLQGDIQDESKSTKQFARAISAYQNAGGNGS